MHIRSILIALAAVIAVGGFSAYAANSHGVAVSTLARTTTAEGVLHGDAVSDLASVQGTTRSTAVRAATPKTETEDTESAACEAAEAALKTDKPEDAAEHAATTATKATDRTEDLLERARAEAERDAVEAACEPVTLSPACQAAIDALKALRTADRAEDKAETRPKTAAQRAADRIEDAAERQPFVAAIKAIKAACVTER